MPKCDGNTDARLRELEIKFTFLDDFVSEQNKTLTELLERQRAARERKASALVNVRAAAFPRKAGVSEIS